jgi:hypothetical protein
MHVYDLVGTYTRVNNSYITFAVYFLCKNISRKGSHGEQKKSSKLQQQVAEDEDLMKQLQKEEEEAEKEE